MNSHKVWHGGTVDGEKRSKAVSSVGSAVTSFTHPPAKATTQLRAAFLSSILLLLLLEFVIPD